MLLLTCTGYSVDVVQVVAIRALTDEAARGIGTDFLTTSVI